MTRHHYESVGNALNQLAAISHVVGRAIPLMGTRVQFILPDSCIAMSKKTQVKYKKAPQAPRRFKSSYMFFSTEKHKSIRKDLAEQGEADKLSTTEVAKMVSQAWKNLSNEEREEWEDMARKDKARYEMEKTMYTGPWKVPAKKRSQKDPNAPKRPMSAFLSFSNSRRSYVKTKHPDIGNAEVSRILAQMWKDASDEERKEHIDNEYKLRQEYKVAIAAWRKNSENEMQAARKEREDQAMQAVLEGKPAPQHPSSTGQKQKDHFEYPYPVTDHQSYNPQPYTQSYSMTANVAPSQPPYYPPPQFYGQGSGYGEGAQWPSTYDPGSYGSYYDRPPGYDPYSPYSHHGSYPTPSYTGSTSAYDNSQPYSHEAQPPQDPHGVSTYYSNHHPDGSGQGGPHATPGGSYLGY